MHCVDRVGHRSQSSTRSSEFRYVSGERVRVNVPKVTENRLIGSSTLRTVRVLSECNHDRLVLASSRSAMTQLRSPTPPESLTRLSLGEWVNSETCTQIL
jgi:hypothetical protein